MTIRIPLPTHQMRKLNYFNAEFGIDFLADYPMAPNINAGIQWIGAKYVEFFGSRMPTIIPPAQGCKIDICCLRDTGVLENVLGVQAANNPQLPSVPVGYSPIYFIVSKAGCQRLTPDMVFDVRSIFSFSNPAPTDLSDYPTKEEVNSKSGTDALTFTLNQSETGTAVENQALMFHRGSMPDTGIRYNEASDRLEFSHDGLVWIEIGMASMALATDQVVGGVKLTTAASNPLQPLAVGDNDGRMLTSQQKTSILNIIANPPQNGAPGTPGTNGTNGVVTITSGTKTPTSVGSQGEMAYDASYVYICVSSNSWVRVLSEATW